MTKAVKPSRAIAAKVRRVLAHILKHPETLMMQYWHCGTTHCFAGHLVLQEGCRVRRDYTMVVPRDLRKRYGLGSKEFNGYDTGIISEKILGIGPNIADRLFTVDYWPNPYRKSYDSKEEDDHLGRAQVLARRFEYFLETGK